MKQSKQKGQNPLDSTDNPQKRVDALTRKPRKSLPDAPEITEQERKELDQQQREKDGLPI